MAIYSNNFRNFIFFLITACWAFYLTSCKPSSRISETRTGKVSGNQAVASESFNEASIRPGAERTRQYFSRIHDKRVAVVANPTSMIGNVHLVDSILSAGIQVVRVFTPEHGFRGQAEAGELVNNSTDALTGLPIVSLYGDHRKPDIVDMQDIDLVIFDIQDVGVRFYTYISTLTLVMEACAENNVSLLVLDRPNPNGFYIDGPVLKPEFTSFVGMHPIPIVYGMTMAEYARMVNGQHWLKDSLICDLDWVEVSAYTHSRHYKLPVNPSPNLKDMNAIYLYPSICLFEGTKVSVGRGTDSPFCVVGYPGYPDGNYQFTPVSIPGASLKPPYMNELCNGYNLVPYVDELLENPGLKLDWLIRMYQSSDKTGFFTSFFDKLAGGDALKQQIESGLTEEEIRQSWQDDLKKFRAIRKKYLLYRDF